MTDSPEALLKSALEKIVYFEARSTQLQNDLNHARAESERLRADLGAASQREIELRRVIAELEVRSTRAHSEREETARVAEALRRERAELIGKMLEASRIHRDSDDDLGDFDLARFIAELRSEVLVQRDGQVVHVAGPTLAQPAVSTPAPERATTAPVTVTVESAPSRTQQLANELRTQGRLDVSHADVQSLQGAAAFQGRSEETLFGFSVRELSAPDVTARARAAERLKALAHPAAAPALAAALNSEREPSVLVALLAALSTLAKAEAVPVIQPHLTSTSPDVRIAALKALLAVDAAHAAPHLTAATNDPDKAVRRRASLMALGLTGPAALALGEHAIRDSVADVRSLAALVLGASGAEAARPFLMDAMRDVDVRVRRAASQALSRLLGQDVTSLVGLDDTQRRREVRRLVNVPSNPVLAVSTPRPLAKPVVTQQHVGASVERSAGGVTLQASSREPVADSIAARGAQALVASTNAAASSRDAVEFAAPSHAAPTHDASSHAAPTHVAPTHVAATHVALTHVAPTHAAPTHAAPTHAAPTHAAPTHAAPTHAAPSSSALHTLRSRVAVLELEEAPAPASSELLEGVMTELRASIRGRPLDELAQGVGRSVDETLRACTQLLQQGHVIRRGHKYFVA